MLQNAQIFYEICKIILKNIYSSQHNQVQYTFYQWRFNVIQTVIPNNKCNFDLNLSLFILSSRYYTVTVTKKVTMQEQTNGTPAYL